MREAILERTGMATHENKLLARLLASAARSRLQSHLQTEDIRAGEVLAEPLEPMPRVYCTGLHRFITMRGRTPSR